MPRGILAIPIAAIVAIVAIIAIGCQAEPKAAPARDPQPAKRAAAPRAPVRTGDYLVYPLNWKHPYAAASELYALLYPKYGPYLQIVPDLDTNSLLIYLPPRASRFQQSY